MSSFLSSFSSEYRTFKLIPRVGQMKNKYGEIQKTEQFEKSITGILFEQRTSQRRFNNFFQGELSSRDTSHMFFFEKGITLNKDDTIIDGEQKFTVKYVKKVYVFNAQYDHNRAELQLVE